MVSPGLVSDLEEPFLLSRQVNQGYRTYYLFVFFLDFLFYFIPFFYPLFFYFYAIILSPKIFEYSKHWRNIYSSSRVSSLESPVSRSTNSQYKLVPEFNDQSIYIYFFKNII